MRDPIVIDTDKYHCDIERDLRRIEELTNRIAVEAYENPDLITGTLGDECERYLRMIFARALNDQLDDSAWRKEISDVLFSAASAAITALVEAELK